MGLVITSNNVQLPGYEELQPATIECESGKIVRVTLGKVDIEKYRGDVEFLDLGDLALLPGLIECVPTINLVILHLKSKNSAHVHLNEPGRTDWEGFYTGTRAAVAGGFTVVVDMPLNSIPPTTTVKNLELKRHAAQGQCWSDVAFWGGVIPHNQNALLPLIKAGVKGFKCFLCESGVKEFPHVTESDAKLAMEFLEPTSSVLLFHAELGSQLGPESRDPTVYDTFLKSRPDSLEFSAIDLIISLNKHYPALRTHIVHLSSATPLSLIKDAKASGLPLTVETCFHYLYLTASTIPSGHPEFKCCPPIRSSENREQLWEALADGTIDFVVSDHSPCVSSLKCFDTGDIMKAWGGIGGLGLGLSLLWTEGRKRGIKMGKIVEWLSEKPAKHAGLAKTKGKIEPGKDADFVVFDPLAEFTVTQESLLFKNKISPYEGLKLIGQVQKTIIRGQVVWDRSRGGDGFDLSPSGLLL
ncbi:allantoinase [Ramaria rubella]|nr:allantoinase [Ramaria rubella]